MAKKPGKMVRSMFVASMLAALCADEPLAVAASIGGQPAEVALPDWQGEIASSSGESAAPIHSWTTVETFSFDYDRATIRAADVSKAIEIAVRVGANAALRIGVDGSSNPRGIGPYSQGLRDRRVEVVREVLIGAGVPAYLIETGPFNSLRATDRRSVDVLLRTSE
jgi:outer membrane protein OmpA-like peptidoglycan-associated protein